MNLDAQRLRKEIILTERRINDLIEEREGLLESMDKINVDLGNNLQAFMETTGQPAEAYYKWRHRARWAAHHKRVALRRTERAIQASKLEHNRLQMILLSEEAGYRGSEPMELLRATYQLLMDVVARTGYKFDEVETGLIATVQLQCGYGVPQVEEDEDAN